MYEKQPSRTPERPRLPIRPSSDRQVSSNLFVRQNELLDQAIEDSFPASDPISPMIIA